MQRKDINQIRHFYLMTVFLLIGFFSMGQVTPPTAYNSGVKVNYVRTWEAAAPETNSAALVSRQLRDVKQTTQFFDGLGRQIQTVFKQGALETDSTARDFVSANVFNEFGFEVYRYLPFAANSAAGNTSISDGEFKRSPFQQQAYFNNLQYGSQGETWFYAMNVIEPSPLNRILETFAPGNSWVGTSGQVLESNRRSVKTKYWINEAIDDVKKWTVSTTLFSWGSYSVTGAYSPGELFKIVTVDETGNQIIEFKNKEGKLILKKVQFTASADIGNGRDYTGWLCTYYVYDDLNNLRCVIQPKGVELLIANAWNMAALGNAILNEQCFRYEYDGRRRIVMKRVPGDGEVYLVYDQWDRIVLSQDANLRLANKWMFTKYDALSRPIMTGLWTDNSHIGLSSMQSYLNTQNMGRFENYDPSGAMPMYSMNQSFPSVSYNDVLTVNYYDDYAWVNNVPSDLRAFESGFNGSFHTPGSSYPYPEALSPSDQTRTLPTGTIIKLTDGSSPLVNTQFYDLDGRVIQKKSENLLGGYDIFTTQYNFSGQVLKTMMRHQKPGVNTVNSSVFSDCEYDDLGRISKVKKTISADINGASTISTGQVTVTQNFYDKLGQLKSKKIGQKKDGSGNYVSDPVETQSFAFNLRGWLLGVNRSEVLNSNGISARFFGYELGYDKLTNSSGRNFTGAQLNGNIGGMVWKTNGDGIRRKYDFTYDLTGRLYHALFEQNDDGSTWGTSLVNYTVKMGNGVGLSTAYDPNGNILQMQQWGLKVTGPTQIDNLNYNYYAYSNRLKNVIDFNSDAQTKLGDFRYSAKYIGELGGSKTSGAADYEYDANGNLKKDRNKDLGDASNNGIRSNFLNLPDSIYRIRSGGIRDTIIYTYNAAGMKLKAEVRENGQPVKTTLYITGYVYENNVLQFLGHEEGRVRFTPPVGATPGKFHSDYFLKDHLGNVRMVLTDEQQQDVYPAASLEGDLNTPGHAAYYEKNFYNLEAAKIVSKSEATGITDYQNNNGNPPYNTNPNGNPTDNSQKLYKLTANTVANGGVTGLGFAIKVMSGDKVDIWAKSYYFQNNTNQDNYNVPVLSILEGFIGTPAGVASGKTTGTELNGITSVTSLINGFLTNAGRGSGTTPRAHVNYILLDENFRYKAGNFSRVGSASSVKNHHDDASMQNIPIEFNGYMYVYVSNESPVNVYFDNLQVIHTRGPILEETHYYPHGLNMAGISGKALKSNYAKNNFNFNGIEQSNALDLNIGEAFFRTHDPQLGRWWQVDPKAIEMFSPYSAMINNPILYSDPLGDTTWVYDFKGQFVGQVNDQLENQIHFVYKATKFSTGDLSVEEANKLGQSYRNKSSAFIGQNTATDMEGLATLAAKTGPEGKEIGFVGIVSDTKEIRLHALPVDETNEKYLVKLKDQIDNKYPTQEQQNAIFLAGHVHHRGQISRFDMQASKKKYSASELHKTLGDPSHTNSLAGQSDYFPVLFRGFDNKKGQSPALIVTPGGFTVYSTATSAEYTLEGWIFNGVNYPPPASFILYRSIKK